MPASCLMQKRSGFVGLLVIVSLLLLFLPTAAQIKSEAEPNDAIEQAQEVRIGENVEGSFQKDSDYDWFRLVVDKPGKNYLRLDLSAVPALDTNFRIYDAKGGHIFEINDGSANEPEVLAHVPVEPGTYFIRIYGSGKASKEKYILSTKITGPWQKGEEAEPNDRNETANELKIGESIAGYFIKDGDSDNFKLIVDKPGRHFIQIDLSAVPKVGTRFNLRDAKGNRLMSIDENYDNQPESLARYTVAEGVYYIEVYGNKKNIENKYDLSTKIEGPWQEGWEFEPNDNLDTADELRLGQNIQGYFQKGGDEDYVKLVVDQPGKNLIQVDLSAVPKVGTRLEIENAEGKRLLRADDNSDGEPESIVSFPVTSGTYYLRINGSKRNLTDKYTLDTRLLGPWQEGMETEANNSLESANEIKLGTPIKGWIHGGYDEDWYRLSIPAPGLEIAVMQVSAVPEVRWRLELLDPKEKRLDYSEFGKKGEGEEIVIMKMNPGTYFLRTRIGSGKGTGAEYALYAGKPQRPPATAEEVGQALVKALDFIASKQQKDGSWERYQQAYTGLSLMAFIGAKCVQKDYSANIKAAVNFLKSAFTPSSKYPEGSNNAAYYGGQLGSDNMYQHAIATLGLIEALVDQNDASLEPIVQEAVQLIIRAQNTEHKPETLRGPIAPDNRSYGGWRYNPSSTDSDISVTGWQILALKAAVNAGFAVPDWAFPAAAKFVRSLQGKQDGSFRYDSPGEKGESCARAGMGALSLQLAGFLQDPLIPPAIRFMQDYAPRWNAEEPGDGYPFYYWYYGTRVMYLAGGDDWRIWKEWMCRFLVDHQNPDGSWDGVRNEEGLDIYRVALGALMLEFCCGHVPIYMSPVKRLGSGFIKVDFEKGAEKETTKNVEIIMDASNSMWGQIGGEAKITIARRVLAQIINGLPDSMNVGLRVYGHRYGLNDKRACTDTELLAPIGPIAKAQLVDTVNKIQLKGKTPLVLSVLEAIKDFEKIPNGSAVLVTDGIESCNGDIMSIAPAIKKSGLELKVHIVGFDIKEKESREQLEAIAKSTEGMYLDAKDAAGLLSSLEQTLKLEFVILDEKGEVAGKGFVGGEEIKLKEGNYTLRVLLAPEPLEAKVAIKPGVKAVHILKKEAGKSRLN